MAKAIGEAGLGRRGTGALRIPRETLGRFVFGPANNRVVEEVRAAGGTRGGWAS